MSQDYYYSRAGQQFGPVSAKELRQLAASGQLYPTDFVWREDLPNWVPASQLQGLFPDGAAVKPVLPPPVPPAPLPVSPPAVVEEHLSPIPNLDLVPGPGQRHEKPAMVAAVIGCGCLLVLVGSTLLTWVSIRVPGFEAFGESWSGLGTTQGKVIGIAALLAAGFLGVGAFFFHPLLATSLLTGGSTATLALILLFSAWSSASRYISREVSSIAILGVRLEGGHQPAFYAAVAMSCIALLAFVFASILKPQPLFFLERSGAAPFILKYGGMVGSQALAILLGLILFLAFY